jgi:hypothetical protein
MQASSKWDPPYCTQATVTGAICSTIVNSFVKTVKEAYPQTGGVVAPGFYSVEYTSTEASNHHLVTSTSYVNFWNKSSSLAPGCTLGCHSCRINGGTVQLIYWRPESSTWINGSYHTVSGNNNETMAVVTLGQCSLVLRCMSLSFRSMLATAVACLTGPTRTRSWQSQRLRT